MTDLYTLTPNLLKSGGVQLESAILKSLSCEVSTIEYITTDEGLCWAQAVEIPKREATNQMEALAMLASRLLHWQEMWPPNETTEENVSLVAEKWLMPDFQRYRFKASSCDEVIACITQVLRPIIAWLEVHSGVEHCGIFRNGIAAPLGGPYPILCDSIRGGIILESVWNSVEVFYETETSVGMLTWGTGA